MKIRVAGEEIILETHENPHFDEEFARWLIENFGTKEFLERYAPERVIQLGIGYGPFDEHPREDEQQRRNECAATLVAKALGIYERPELKRLLGFALNRDRNGPQLLDLVHITNLWRRKFPNDPGKVFQEISKIIELEHQEQLYFHTVVGKKFERDAKTEETSLDEEVIKIVTILSDEYQMSRYFRFRVREPGILIQGYRSGHIRIFANRIFKIRWLEEIAAIIRYESQRAKGNILTKDWNMLRKEGEVKGAEEWYYHPAGFALLNGSITHPDVAPTNLSLNRIKTLVRIGIDCNAFESSRSQLCKTGFCSSSLKESCPWYPWGLKRCRRVRKGLI
ncbi:hypothetical protein KJA16_01720 [Patescibacteria group bacterium]|nr:hypothetical protein [Patescibacteria group bacterium]